MGPKELFPSAEMLQKLKDLGIKCSVQSEVDLRDGYDIAYVNRLQEERFPDQQLFEKNRKKFRLTRADIEDSDTIILDPLPRIDEISTDVDSLPNALYFNQASYGVPMRMALLAMLLGKA